MKLPKLRDLLRGRRSGHSGYDSPDAAKARRAAEQDRAQVERERQKMELRLPPQGPLNF